MKIIIFAIAGFLLPGPGNNSPQNAVSTDSNYIFNFKKSKEMDTQESFTTTILVNKTAAEAFDATINFRAWWSEDIEGATDKLGETFFYHHKELHLCKIKLKEMIAGKKLVYLVVANEFSFIEDKTEWVDTKLVFDFSSENGQTKVKFTHEGLVPQDQCYNVCHDAWTGFIQKSLKNLINTGKGEPNPKDGTNDINAENIRKWNIKH